VKSKILILVFFFQSIKWFSAKFEIDQSWLKIRREYISKAGAVIQTSLLNFKILNLIKKTELKLGRSLCQRIQRCLRKLILIKKTLIAFKQKNDSLNTHLVSFSRVRASILN